MSYCTDSTKVVTGSDDKTVRIWSTTSGDNDDRETADQTGFAAKVSANISGIIDLTGSQW